MKVRELIEHLQKANPEANINMASDPEGNEIRTLSNIDRESMVVTLWPGGPVMNTKHTPGPEGDYTEADYFAECGFTASDILTWAMVGLALLIGLTYCSEWIAKGCHYKPAMPVIGVTAEKPRSESRDGRTTIVELCAADSKTKGVPVPSCGSKAAAPHEAKASREERGKDCAVGLQADLESSPAIPALKEAAGEEPADSRQTRATGTKWIKPADEFRNGRECCCGEGHPRRYSRQADLQDRHTQAEGSSTEYVRPNRKESRIRAAGMAARRADLEAI